MLQYIGFKDRGGAAGHPGATRQGLSRRPAADSGAANTGEAVGSASPDGLVWNCEIAIRRKLAAAVPGRFQGGDRVTRYAPAVVMVLVALCLGSTAFGGANPSVTLPLHARLTSGSCTQFAPVNCTTTRPTVNVTSQTDYVIYLLIFNYANVAGVQTAFDWAASWVLQDVAFNCRAGQVNATAPDPSVPGGPTTGTISSAFTCISTAALATIGRLTFTTGDAGCVFQVQSSYPFGDHVIDCTNGVDQINADDPVHQMRLGKVCVTSGGVDACTAIQPVDAATWGGIKATYAR